MGETEEGGEGRMGGAEEGGEGEMGGPEEEGYQFLSHGSTFLSTQKNRSFLKASSNFIFHLENLSFPPEIL